MEGAIHDFEGADVHGLNGGNRDNGGPSNVDNDHRDNADENLAVRLVLECDILITKIMLPIKKEIRFHFQKTHRKLLDSGQFIHLRNIERQYRELAMKCHDRINIIQSGTHKEWITARIRMHTSSSVIRLLLLCESFCDSAKKLNGPGCASIVKSMVEIPLHLGHLLWILRRNPKFDDVRHQLDRIAFGNPDPQTGLTSRGKVNAKEMCDNAEAMFDEIFPPKDGQRKIISTIYKEANATGHNNYEALMYSGRMDRLGFWEASKRDENFLFLTNNIFQLFLACYTTLFVTGLFINALESHLEQMPEYLQ